LIKIEKVNSLIAKFTNKGTLNALWLINDH